MSVLKGKKIKIFSLSSNVELANDIVKHLNIELSNCEVQRFLDGEINIKITETVRDHDVFVVQPTSPPVNENLMELLIMCDALKRAAAKSITVIVPYYGYSRQDRKTLSRQPITAKLVADLIEKSGVNRVVCMDLHAAQIQGFFDIPIDNFLALPLFVEYFSTNKTYNLTNLVVVSPDYGGTSRAREFSRALHAPLAIIDKRRPEPNKAEVMNVLGDISGKDCILIDDIVDTAGTLCAASNALMKLGAKSVYAVCTHAILSADAVDKIKNSTIKKLITTNTIKLKKDKMLDKIEVLSVGPLLAEGIKNIISGEPLSELFTYNQERKLCK